MYCVTQSDIQCIVPLAETFLQVDEVDSINFLHCHGNGMHVRMFCTLFSYFESLATTFLQRDEVCTYTLCVYMLL